MEKTVLKFNKRHEKWMKGDVACFACEEAEEILKTGKAEFHSKINFEENNKTIITGEWKKRVAGIKESPQFICPICGIKFLSQEEKDAHKLEVHGIA